MVNYRSVLLYFNSDFVNDSFKISYLTSISLKHFKVYFNFFQVKISMLTLALMSVGSILFAFTSLLSLLSVQWRTTTTEIPNSATDGSTVVRYAMYEIASSLFLIAVSTSISTFLLSTLQLFFALKMLKANPTSIKRSNLNSILWCNN